jgi:NitT/TauT family transport system substrate-binding protein
VCVKESSPIRIAKDLEGQIVGVLGVNNIGDVAVRSWMDKNGGDSKSVRFVELPFPAMKAAIVSGRVAAATLDVTADPTAGKPGDPLRILCSSFDAIGPRFVPSVWFTTDDWLRGHASAARSFVDALRRTASWANEHHAETAQILAKYTHATVANIEAATRATYAEQLTAGEIQPNIDAAAKYGVIASAFRAAQVIATPPR